MASAQWSIPAGPGKQPTAWVAPPVQGLEEHVRKRRRDVDELAVESQAEVCAISDELVNGEVLDGGERNAVQQQDGAGHSRDQMGRPGRVQELSQEIDPFRLGQ
jgi:hypothetical protein